jgi:hypothetical protein
MRWNEIEKKTNKEKDLFQISVSMRFCKDNKHCSCCFQTMNHCVMIHNDSKIREFIKFNNNVSFYGFSCLQKDYRINCFFKLNLIELNLLDFENIASQMIRIQETEFLMISLLERVDLTMHTLNETHFQFSNNHYLSISLLLRQNPINQQKTIFSIFFSFINVCMCLFVCCMFLKKSQEKK